MKVFWIEPIHLKLIQWKVIQFNGSDSGKMNHFSGKRISLDLSWNQKKKNGCSVRRLPLLPLFIC